MTISNYTRPILFRELKDGAEFTLLLHDVVFIKVPPQEIVQSGGNKKIVNAMSESKIFRTWVMGAEMTYIKEANDDT